MKTSIEQVQKTYAQHVRVIKAKTVSKTLLLVLACSTEMSYFSPSGKARLGVKRSYFVEYLMYEADGKLGDSQHVAGFSNKSEALKAFTAEYDANFKRNLDSITTENVLQFRKTGAV